MKFTHSEKKAANEFYNVSVEVKSGNKHARESKNKNLNMEQERPILFLSKFRQLAVRKYGYGVNEHDYMNVLIFNMKKKDFSRLMWFGALYHYNRISRFVKYPRIVYTKLA